MTVETVVYAGHEAVRLQADGLTATMIVSVGPRIIEFRNQDTANLLAELPGAGIDTDGSRFTFYGGHRLWVAPEVPSWTYEPDDRPALVDEIDGGVRIAAAPSGIGIDKVMTVRIEDERLHIGHTLVNGRDNDVQLSAWAITQLVPGGVAFVPLPDDPRDPHGLQANTSIIGWPYTDFGDPALRLHKTMAEVIGPRTSPTKIGTPLRRGWLAYQLGGDLFVKRASHIDGAPYIDHDASGQCYYNDTFAELETLSPAWVLTPGDNVSHDETWELHAVGARLTPTEVTALAQS